MTVSDERAHAELTGDGQRFCVASLGVHDRRRIGGSVEVAAEKQGLRRQPPESKAARALQGMAAFLGRLVEAPADRQDLGPGQSVPRFRQSLTQGATFLKPMLMPRK